MRLDMAEDETLPNSLRLYQLNQRHRENQSMGIAHSRFNLYSAFKARTWREKLCNS